MNNYIVANQDGEGPGFNNMCARAPKGTSFVDSDKDTAGFHTYAFEWHTGGPNCKPRVDFFFDGKYIATNDVFVPSRVSRFTVGIWPGKWAGAPDWKGEVYADIAEIHVCPYNEANDANYPQIWDQPFNYNQLWQNNLTLAPAKPSLPAAEDVCKHADTCTGASDRPNGCSCDAVPKHCASGCCDYNAVPGDTRGKCADDKVCISECRAATGRPFDCFCTNSSQCGTGCCSNGLCATKEQCTDPCSDAFGRGDGCPCGLAGACKSRCCDYKATPGFLNGTCAEARICIQECSVPKVRPIGCSCDGGSDCSTGCCSSETCSNPESCPAPSKCAEPKDKPLGCSCFHSGQCKSNWCAGKPAVCTPH